MYNRFFAHCFYRIAGDLSKKRSITCKMRRIFKIERERKSIYLLLETFALK